MITAVHTLIYSDDAPATRAFLRDVLGLPFVEDTGTEEGWLIFGTGPSEMGVHPTVAVHEGKEYRSPRHHAVSFMCDDIAATLGELTSRGATVLSGPDDRGFGLTAMIEVPGADPLMIYEPRHETAYDR
jgi:catechol 2,3-dioxygenase-like lactoylglutathione lyase family enzyme